MNRKRGCWAKWLLAVSVGLVLMVGGCRPKPAQEGVSARTTSPVSNVSSGRAPNFTLTDLDGKPVSLSNYAGKGIILDFWGTWCPPCVKGVPEFAELYETHKDKGLVIVGVALDDTADLVKQFVAKYHVPYPILHGTPQMIGQVVQAYGSFEFIPTTFLIAPDGEIVQRFEGYHAKQEFENLIPRLLPNRVTE